jgi:hypothetical protein
VYEVILGPAARQAFQSLPAGTEQEKLADALRRELRGDPNAATRIRFDRYGKPRPEADLDGRDATIYMASPLSFMAHTAVYRRMTEGELDRLSREQQRPAASEGFLVVDILRAELGFTRWTWSADD